MPGTVGTAPFGSNVRSIVIKVDPDRLRSYNLTPDDVVKALTTGNVIVPAGNLYIKDQMPLVPTNAMIADIQEIGKIPVQPGRNVYIRDVATVADATDVNFGYALVDGHRSVYMPIVKKNTASTLTVVADIHRAMPTFQERAARRRWRSATSSTNRRRWSRPSSSVAIEGADRRHADRADDPAVPARLAQRDRRGLQHSRWRCSARCGPVDHRQHDQHHDAGRPGPVDRHAGRRGDRVDRKHPRADGRTRRRWPGRWSAAATKRPCRACWPCCASCRCSSRPSSWPSRCGRCSCRCRWRSASP